MSSKKTISFCLLSFCLGGASCFLLLKYAFPNLVSVEQSLKEESVYQVEHNECPAKVEPVAQCNVFVDISGAVRTPGVYCFNQGDRVVDAIKKAGGYSKNVALDYISRDLNLAKTLVNNQKIYIPSTKELLCELKDFTLKPEEVLPVEDTSTTTTTEDTSTTSDNTTTETDCVNINSGSLEELDSLSGVGPSTAQKIINSRPYNLLTDLLNVSGIGQATYDKFKDKICL